MNMKRGSLIAMEGIDGSGKGTQVELLEKALAARGHSVFRIAFPQYDSWFGRMVAQFLNGEFGPLETVDPHFTAMLYAGDRFEAKPQIEAALARGFVVLADRYIYTLLARAIVRGMEPDWIQEVYSIALVPDAVFYIAVSPEILIERNLRKHTVLDYWESGMDMDRSLNMYDSFIHYQKKIQKQFKQMQKVYGFETVNGNRGPRSIQKELQAKIGSVLNGKIVPMKEKTFDPGPREQIVNGTNG